MGPAVNAFPAGPALLTSSRPMDTAKMHRIPWWCAACHATTETMVHAREDELADRVKVPRGWFAGQLEQTPVTLCRTCTEDACATLASGDVMGRVRRVIERHAKKREQAAP